MSEVHPFDLIMAFEVYDPEQVDEDVIEIAVVQRMIPDLSLAGYDATTYRRYITNYKMMVEPVGCPFVISLPKSQATYSRLARFM